MGAWGHGSFENDDAGDWVWGLEKAADFDVVKTALNAVVAEGDYLEAPTCSVAIAAAEIVAAALGRPVAALPDEARSWVEAHRDVPPDVVVLARRAIALIADKSELRDLWEEGEDFAQWQSSIADLAARIAGWQGSAEDRTPPAQATPTTQLPAQDPKAPSTAAEFAWAAKRARLGLILGPGSLLLANLLAKLMGFLGRTPSELTELALCVLHLASFIELVATVRVLRRPKFPVTVLALAVYWAVLAVLIAWQVAMRLAG